MTDERFNKLLDDAAGEYNTPPQAPSEKMWGRIQERRRPRRSRAGRFFTAYKVWAPLAAAAVLLFGIMLGRDTLRDDAAQHIAKVEQDAKTQVDEVRKEAGREKAEMFYRYAAAPYLSRAEALLTQYRIDGGNPEIAATMAGWTDELIVETKLLMDSPASTDPEMKGLLQDLELTLIRIRTAIGSESDLDRELLDEGLTDNNLMMRLRAKIPAGGSRLGT